MTEQFDTYINSLLKENDQRYLRILQQLTPQNIADAREWISDCEWGNLEPDDIAELSDIDIVRGVDRHYSGGWEEFLRNG